MNDDAPAWRGPRGRRSRRDRRRALDRPWACRPAVRSPGRVEGARARHRGDLTHRGERVDASGGDGHAGCDGDGHGEVFRRRDGRCSPSARCARLGCCGCRSGSWLRYCRRLPVVSIGLASVLVSGCHLPALRAAGQCDAPRSPWTWGRPQRAVLASLASGERPDRVAHAAARDHAAPIRVRFWMSDRTPVGTSP